MQPGGLVTPDVQMVDWLASLVDRGQGELAGGPSQKTAALARRGFQREELGRGWGRLRVSRKGSVTIARVIVAELIKDPAVTETIDEVMSLVTAGCDQLVVNLCEVDRITSYFLATLAEAHKRCRSVQGGGLRVCGLHEGIRPIFRLTGLDRELRIFEDEATAISTSWPSADIPRPLPIAMLAPLRARDKDKVTPMDDAVIPVAKAVDPRLPSLSIRIEVGPRKGTVLNVRQAPWTIGRDEACKLRCLTDVVSRIHAQLEPDGITGWQIRDLCSTNGTFVNGDRIEGGRRLAAHDHVRIGPLTFTVMLGQNARGPSSLDDQIANLLRDPFASQNEAATGDMTREVPSTVPAEVPVSPIRLSRFEDVDVVALRIGDVVSEQLVNELEETLEKLRTERPEAHVVIDLSVVSTISSRALGLMLAFALRLGRSGGGIRFAHPRPVVRTRFDLLRVSELIAVFDTVDEAVVAAW